MYLTEIIRLFSECDGVILNTSYSIEPEGIAAWKHWLGERPVFSLGPLSPPAVSDVELPSEDLLYASTDVEKFLDDALLNYGENSVVYVSEACHYVLHSCLRNI